MRTPEVPLGQERFMLVSPRHLQPPGGRGTKLAQTPLAAAAPLDLYLPLIHDSFLHKAIQGFAIIRRPRRFVQAFNMGKMLEFLSGGVSSDDQRQSDAEGGAVTGFALHVDLAVVGLDDSLDDV